MGIIEVVTIVLALLKWYGIIAITWGAVFTPMAIVYALVIILALIGSALK